MKKKDFKYLLFILRNILKKNERDKIAVMSTYTLLVLVFLFCQLHIRYYSIICDDCSLFYLTLMQLIAVI